MSKVLHFTPRSKGIDQFCREQQAFQAAIAASPDDRTVRGAYADFLEEGDRGFRHYSRESKLWLREATEPTTFTLCRGGRVWCGPLLTVAEVRELAEDTGSSRVSGAQVVDTVLFSGPAGNFFVVGERSQTLGSPKPVALWQYDHPSRRLWLALYLKGQPRLKGLKRPYIEDARWLAALASGAAVPSLPPSLLIQPLGWKGAKPVV